ncbi:alpha-1,6-glucosidase domain-containing protein [Inhella sp.]|uniref:alpha-1,6-glucosidase domain-containing protein n=1 Tax=Inhella sp. TaxID=1921806 RepID=UPI0035AF9739
MHQDSKLLWVAGALLAVWGGPVWAAADDLAACDEARSPFAQPLEGSLLGELPARAYWLDAERLLWPGQPANGRYRLLPPQALKVGEAPVQTGWALQPAAPLTPASAERWKFVPAGALLGFSQTPTREALVQALREGWVLASLDPATGALLAHTRLQHPGALDALFAGAAWPLAMGPQVGRGGSSGRVWAPTARRVEVCLYPAPEAAPARRVAARWEAASGSWHWQQPDDLRGWLYTYLVEVQVPGQGWVRQRVTDPYSVSLNANSQRSALLDLDDASLKPSGWSQAAQHPRPRAGLRLHEMVVYELHVRDFSLQDPAVPRALRGKYGAFTVPQSAGMRHLRELARAGVTDLHLLPPFDLSTVPEQGCVSPDVPRAAPDSDAQQAAVMKVAGQDCFNWGYDPQHFNAPEGSFASSAMDPAARVREFRQMVMGLHRAGLRVGMDVVYNHTSHAGQAAKSVLDRVVPGYYQRLNGEGVVERSTCCDNTATEHAMMDKLMSDSVLLWARHYALDSFRFDLMGHQPRAAMLAMQARLKKELGRDILFIGEGWNFGEVANGARFRQAIQTELAGDGIGTFSDRARDALRGGSFGSVPELMAAKGWSNGLLESGTRAQQLQAADQIRLGLAGTLRDYRFVQADGQLRRGAELPYGGGGAGYAAQPGEAVAYVENHDNHTLFDANVLKMPASSTALERLQAQTVAGAAVLFSQGVAYIHAGQELLRSKSLDRNSYDSGDWFNRYDPTLRDNGFAAGLPPATDNGRDFEALKPLLRLAHAKPSSAQIEQARRAFLDLLRIRDGSSLFRLGSAEEVQKRLRLHNTGPQQDPALIVAELDGEGWPGAGARGLLLVLNGAAQSRQLKLPQLATQGWRLHPQLARPGAGDPRIAREARWRSGQLTMPSRSVAVYVR